MGIFSNSLVQNINIGPNVRYLNESMYNAFYGCYNFNSVIDIPNTITNMDNTFASCNNFNQSVTIPNSVTNMSYTFASCNNFNQSVTIPNSVTNVKGLFYYCNTFNRRVDIPNGITDLSYAFQNCQYLNSYMYIPDTVTNMVYTFYGCNRLNANTLYIRNYQEGTIQQFRSGLQNMAITNLAYAFYNCRGFNAQSVRIPDSVTNMAYALSYCAGYPSYIGNNVTNLYYACYNIPSSGSAITLKIYSKNVTNAYRFIGNQTRTRYLNIYVPNGSTTMNTFLQTSASTSITGTSLYWSQSNTERFNSTYYIRIIPFD